MSDFKVTRVRRESCGYYSRHIIGVITQEQTFWPNAYVAASIKQGGKWVTWVPGSPEATIRPVDKCPRCSTGPYLRTDADSTAKNNLENLPEG